jgi:hypothetical protein
MLPSTNHGSTEIKSLTNSVSLSDTASWIEEKDFHQKVAISSTPGDAKFRFPVKTFLTSTFVMPGSPSRPARVWS